MLTEEVRGGGEDEEHEDEGAVLTNRVALRLGSAISSHVNLVK